MRQMFIYRKNTSDISLQLGLLKKKHYKPWCTFWDALDNQLLSLKLVDTEFVILLASVI